MTFFQRKVLVLLLLLSYLTASPTYANKLNQAMGIDLATQKAALQSQQKINTLSNQAQTALTQYRSAIRQTDALVTYNEYLQELLKSQTQEKRSLQHQLEQIEVTQQEIVPLILRMLDNLENFIRLDLPFLPEERAKRIENLKKMMISANVTDAEKFRRIIEAYQIENDYGKTIESYRADLELGGKKVSVDILRLGRVALYYQRLDRSETGMWNQKTKTWDTLPSDYRIGVRNGLRIARKEVAPDLIVVPVPAAEAVQ